MYSFFKKINKFLVIKMIILKTSRHFQKNSLKISKTKKNREQEVKAHTFGLVISQIRS